MWIEFLPLVTNGKNYGFRGKMCGAWYCHIYLALPDSLTLWFHEIFKLIFLKPSSWSKTMYAEHWSKLAWATPLGIFPILNNSVEHLRPVAYLNMLLCLQSKKVLIGYFGFLFWFSSAILLSKMKSLFLNFYTSSWWVTALLQLPIHHGKCALISKLKRFSLVKLWYTIWTYGGFNSKVTISKSSHIVFILFKIAWVEIYFWLG